MQKYDEEFKLTIVKEYLKGTSGSKAIAAKYGVSRVSIKDWANFIVTTVKQVFVESPALTLPALSCRC